MTTSLAASPVLPIATAVAAAALIFGTLSNTATGSTNPLGETSGLPAADQSASPPAAEVPPAPAGNTVPAQCKGKVCTITFPKAGDSAQAFGTTVTAVRFYVDGLQVSIGTTPIVSSLKVANKAGGFTLKVLKVDKAAGVTVRITQK